MGVGAHKLRPQVAGSRCDTHRKTNTVGQEIGHQDVRQLVAKDARRMHASPGTLRTCHVQMGWQCRQKTLDKLLPGAPFVRNVHLVVLADGSHSSYLACILCIPFCWRLCV